MHMKSLGDRKHSEPWGLPVAQYEPWHGAKAASRDGTEGVSGVQTLGSFGTLLRCLFHREQLRSFRQITSLSGSLVGNELEGLLLATAP